MSEIIACTSDGIEIYDNDIDFAIADGCEKYGIDDLTKAGQKQFKCVCGYVGKTLFNNGILKSKTLVNYNNNNIPTNNNSYDYELIDKLSDYFNNNVCDRYNKLMSMEALSLFLGMARDTIRIWGQSEPSSTTFRIFKKCRDGRLEGILDNAYDNGNVTGTMFVGNVEYGLNLPGVSKEQAKPQKLTASELPKLSQNAAQLPDTQAQKPLEIVSDG
jgi:hypothetical protein